jgi:hypothetical protein
VLHPARIKPKSKKNFIIMCFFKFNIASSLLKNFLTLLYTKALYEANRPDSLNERLGLLFTHPAVNPATGFLIAP